MTPLGVKWTGALELVLWVTDPCAPLVIFNFRATNYNPAIDCRATNYDPAIDSKATNYDRSYQWF